MLIDKIINEYDKDYCTFLELCYGEGLMSEGGTEAINDLIKPYNLNNKKVLEIGFGLGGMAKHLAKKFPQIDYYGLEINPYLVKTATVKYSQENVKFLLSKNNDNLPFEDCFFDYILSDGVLVHVPLKTKPTLFNELSRIIRKSGQIIIFDWLSRDGVGFGEKIDKMSEIEGLSLFPTTEKQYRGIFKNLGFKDIQISDENTNYTRYNHNVVKRMQSTIIKNTIIKKYGLEYYNEAVNCYKWIAEAFAENELLARKITAKI
ncbi:methyltransferase domain-containing protein [Francisella sp. Scap27]|uniref:class I SAM-dependent methyltransferase n=1 Tax=Francisella sp. Scap27 TaxID=2589986 RepID=UPI0015C10D4F|nr:class I SAM-dependent methyltransferase [Francisella sp. Scap27]QLE78655.1 methyltransferase domain-containing protein [Francisella sp. Scap27]